MKATFYIIVYAALLSSCVAAKYNPEKKFSPQELQKDYTLLRNVLEESHPSLYWYTPKDSMDLYFDAGRRMLKDSLTELKFRNVLTYVVSKIRCGHTSVRASKAAAGYRNLNAPSLPLVVKTWPDTTVITLNLNRKDSMIKRGVILKSIDGKAVSTIIDSFFSHLTTDGYNTTHKYQTLSNGRNFSSMYAAFYGLKPRPEIEYVDSAGNVRKTKLTLYNPAADSLQRQAVPRLTAKERRKLQRESVRNLRIDTALNAAVMEVNSFAKFRGLRGFFRKSFKYLREQNIQNLIVDMRSNGGGSVVLSNLLTKYMAQAPFKIADSLYATQRASSYGRYRESYLVHWLFLNFFTRKKSDGNYHFTFYENKFLKPKKKYNYKGTAYILTGGNTFSAASLFTKSVAKQQNVIVVGEETGGGAYGNTAWLIPDVTLPNTGVRFRLPLFRLVIDKDEVKGRGVLPEVEAMPTVDYIRRGVDFKMEKAKELIKKSAHHASDNNLRKLN